MSATLPISQPPDAATFFSGYRPLADAWDEMLAKPGELRAAWRTMIASMDKLGRQELADRWEQAVRLIRENGVTYSPSGDPDSPSRPWDLDAVPLAISAEEWRGVSQGLVQRARLLDRVLADIYGPQLLLQSGVLPPELVFSHPGFHRSFHGQPLAGGRFLHLFAVDLARGADGRWYVMADRTDAPLGAGYALENRIVISRMIPSVIRDCQVERLAPFFIAIRESLRQLAPQRRENPRVVVLSQGPRSMSYYEDTYLARYLGYTLVESGDLTVRNDKVLLKTLAGLLPVDVILRRMTEGRCDPLELRDDASLGVPGLLQAIRQGNVAVANALGSGLLESPAFLPYLPNLCKAVLGEELLMPSVGTWWCGNAQSAQHVLANLEKMTIRPAFRRNRKPVASMKPGADKTDWEKAILARPGLYVGQERSQRSTAPVWSGGDFHGNYVAMRAFLAAAGDSYVVMPGGLVRVASQPEPLDTSILAGAGSKDAWVLSEGPVRQVTLLHQPGQRVELRRSGAELPSRVADNMFWLGRYIERADNLTRLLRTVLTRLTSESSPEAMPELAVLLRNLAAQGQIEPGFVVEGIRQQLPSIETSLPSNILDPQQPSSLRSTLSALFRLASLVRDRLSIDSYRILYQIDRDLPPADSRHGIDLIHLLGVLNRMVIDLSAFSGLVAESMTRTQGWRFLDIGRRLERSLHVISLVQTSLMENPHQEGAVLEAVLEVADSIMTYRSRYLASLHPATVLDLILTDETNPRSLAFQLAMLADHVENLPRDHTQPLRGAEQRVTMNALHSIRMVDLDLLSETTKEGSHSRLDRLLSKIAGQMPRLSDLISHKFFVHAGTLRQLSGKM